MQVATDHHPLKEAATNLVSDAPELLRRGQSVLRQLQHATRLARLEAQVHDLQAALALAEIGESQTLVRWLESFEGQARLQPECVPLAEQVAPGIASQSLSLTTTTPLPCEPLDSGWSTYALNARRRLRELEATHGCNLPWNDDELFSRDPQLNSSAVDGALPTSDSQVDQPIELSDQLDGDQLDSDQLDDELPEDALRDVLGSQDESSKPDAASATMRKRLLGSYGLSVIGHAMLLIILGTITFQPVSEGNSLGSQVLNAAEARSEVEVASEVELLEPTELEMSEPVLSTSEPVSVASELAQLSASVSPVSVDVTANSASTSLASAFAEATSKSAAAVNRQGGGAPNISGKFFGVGTGGNYFCYVVDRSGSMRGGAWESAKAELLRSLKSLKPTQKFYIVFFADEFEALPEPGKDVPADTGLYATAENVEHARQWIQSVQLNRGGPPNAALEWAIGREPDAIYLLTDGVTKVDVCAHLRRVNRIDDIVSGTQVHVPIHAIAYHSLEGQQLMRQLAQENQGQFIYVPKPKK